MGWVELFWGGSPFLPHSMACPPPLFFFCFFFAQWCESSCQLQRACMVLCQVVYEELSNGGVATLKRTAYSLRGGDTLYGPTGAVTGWRRVGGDLGHKAGRFVDDRTQPGINTPTNFALLHRVAP